MIYKTKSIYRIISIFMLLALMLSSCGGNENSSENNISSEVSSENNNSSENGENSIPTDEYKLPLEDGYNQLTLYWKHNGTYDNCDIWIWYGDVAGKGYTFHPCSYGAKVVVNVPESVEQVGFIVRKDCSNPGGSSWDSATKDFEQDRFAVIEGKETFIYLKSGVGDQFKSNDGGKTLEIIKKFSLAGIVDEKKIKFHVTPGVLISALDDVSVTVGGKVNKVVSVSTVGKNAMSGYIEVENTIALSDNCVVEIKGFGESVALPTDIFDSEWFANNYHYDGKDLGATVKGDKTEFKVWAPTASEVILNLFEKGNDCEAYKSVNMTLGDKGVWSYTEDCGHGTYYTYTVTTANGKQEAVDPYAKSTGVNGDRGMVVDLSLTNPKGWENTKPVETIKKYSDAIIWEIHVRDFSNKIESSNYKGKYLAFTEKGLVNENGKPVGVDYLKELGITHVHLLPVYDYASVDETNPSSGFNWGYDPENYNAPEGSYATDPYNGEVRIKEFKQMVMALHNEGIGVVMDVVYNHTYDANSSLNKIVPYYYYRYTDTGANSSASGCGNDTASERYMYGKFMVDSTSYWAEEYKLDGFRFDLMGLHDLETMQEVESAVHTINPNAIIYGEGWTMGSTIDGSAQANQGEISKIIPTGNAIGGIAVFNDNIRDGLKGSVFSQTGKGFINGAPNSGNLQKVIFGIKGGESGSSTWFVKDSMVINYMSAHDNNTLWDKLYLSCPESTDDERNSMNKLGAAIIMMSKGTPFWQAGEEMLRTKDGDENSYKSSDEINNINWSVLNDNSREYKTFMYYKGLIEMRKAYSIFSDEDTVISHTEHGSGIVEITFDDGKGGKAVALINPNRSSLPYTLDGEWNLIVNSESAGDEVIEKSNGNVSVMPYSVNIYVNNVVNGDK